MNLSELATIVRDVTCIVTLAAMLIRPIRERLFGDKAIKEGHKCLLRAELLRTYYRHQDTKSLRQYEYQNVCYCYEAYKALGGNSFVERIYREMQSWEVHT